MFNNVQRPKPVGGNIKSYYSLIPMCVYIIQVYISLGLDHSSLLFFMYTYIRSKVRLPDPLSFKEITVQVSTRSNTHAVDTSYTYCVHLPAQYLPVEIAVCYRPLSSPYTCCAPLLYTTYTAATSVDIQFRCFTKSNSPGMPYYHCYRLTHAKTRVCSRRLVVL